MGPAGDRAVPAPDWVGPVRGYVGANQNQAERLCMSEAAKSSRMYGSPCYSLEGGHALNGLRSSRNAAHRKRRSNSRFRAGFGLLGKTAMVVAVVAAVADVTNGLRV